MLSILIYHQLCGSLSIVMNFLSQFHLNLILWMKKSNPPSLKVMLQKA
ncbi:unnamed protein product [Acanthoscelides obtectus]|uniref:Uncharacterized protein n=1 Tax=Acanthoscelides obtectus TaxID=200917 RepID=A0A9P0K4D7_ACAOB|nr:unnamed protein product [Acanthoscelides obtectus]CAK1676669.1 hypothetical protein AOBTE_LOCUS30896 [Acanthoscelides obtectus]